jgi:hypothetical protein
MSNKILFLTLSLALLFSTIPMTFLNPVRADVVIVLSSSGWIDSSEVYHVTGEVQNTGSNTVSFVEISATFYDSSNKVVDTQFTYAYLSYVQPNAKSPFDVIDLQSTMVPKIDHYNLQTSYMPSSSHQECLQILSNSSYTDSTGAFHVAGEIKNTGTATSTSTEVYATFYDQTGKVVDASFALTNPDTVAPGSTSPFDITSMDSTRVPLISSYSLTAESNEYELTSTNPSPSTSQTASFTPIPAATSTATPVPTETPSTNPSPTIPELPPFLTVILFMILAFASSVVIKIRNWRSFQ